MPELVRPKKVEIFQHLNKTHAVANKSFLEIFVQACRD
jgi:hypothetical protein